jgi:hypothetical protein
LARMPTECILLRRLGVAAPSGSVIFDHNISKQS